MIQTTRQEVRLQMRRRYVRAGRNDKSQRVRELAELFGVKPGPAKSSPQVAPQNLASRFHSNAYGYGGLLE